MAETTGEQTLAEHLIGLEREKWRELALTGTFSRRWFSNDFYAVGYLPDAGGDVSRKPEPTEAGVAGAGFQYSLDGFRVIKLTRSTNEYDADGAVVTYEVHGPVELNATSVWVRRDGRWQTAFYQSSPREPQR